MAELYDLMSLGQAPADWQQQASAPAPSQPMTLADIGAAPTPIDVDSQIAAQNMQMGVPQPLGYVGRGDVVSLPSTRPPQTNTQAARPAMPQLQPTKPAQGGGFRSILSKEAKAREADAQAAGARLQQSAEEFAKKSSDLVGVQQQGMAAQGRAADTTAQAIEATRKSAEDARMMDEGERLLEQDAIEARRQKIAAGYDKLSKERVVDRRSVPARMMSTIGVALAGIGDAMMAGAGRQGNAMQTTLQMIDRSVERDADEQRRIIDAKRDALGADEQRLKDFTAQVGNDRAARQYAIAQQWEDYGHVAQQIEANTTSEMKRNAAVELGAYAQQQNAAARMAGDQALAEDTQERLRSLRDLSFNLQLKQSMGTGKPKDAPAAYGLRQLKEGTTGDATKAQEIASGFSGVRETIAQLKAMAAEGPTLSVDKRATARRRLASIKSQFNGTFGDGTAPNEAQLEALDEIFANPTEVNMGSALKQFEAFDQDATALANAKMRAYGYALDDIDTRAE